MNWRLANPSLGFNEAACNTGGTHRGIRRLDSESKRFNEAACNTGGTHPHDPVPAQRQRRASMRPPAIQAERAQRGAGETGR